MTSQSQSQSQPQPEIVTVTVQIEVNGKLRGAYEQRLHDIAAGMGEQDRREMLEMLHLPTDPGELICLLLGNKFESFQCGNGQPDCPVLASDYDYTG